MKTLVSPRKAKKFFRAKREFTIGPVELNCMIRRREDINIVDMRTSGDYAAAHIPGATNLPRSKWPTCAHLERKKLNVVYCYSEVCRMAAVAESDFAAHGYPIVQLDGGFEAWQFYGLPIESLRRPVAQARKIQQKTAMPELRPIPQQQVKATTD
ncbi:MAG: rhodanese-like domain-containing protein [Planctomycetes bacterium]|nr:rhodanese-like domain-containing protein [Planctomycetota bacterium]